MGASLGRVWDGVGCQRATVDGTQNGRQEGGSRVICMVVFGLST
jgi:hypothetical protein